MGLFFLPPGRLCGRQDKTVAETDVKYVISISSSSFASPQSEMMSTQHQRSLHSLTLSMKNIELLIRAAEFLEKPEFGKLCLLYAAVWCLIRPKSFLAASALHEGWDYRLHRGGLGLSDWTG